MAAIALFVGGLVLLVAGAELLVRGASQLARAAGVTPLVVGLTVVAFGTSAPELAVALQSAFTGQNDLAVGNILGSNIFNILFVLGLSSVVLPMIVSRQLVLTDVPIMVAISFLAWGLALDGGIGRLDGAVLLAVGITYIVWLIRVGRTNKAAPGTPHLPWSRLSLAGLAADVGLVVAGAFMLVWGADWLVDSASIFAERLGVSQLVIGLTIVAVGTSLPEAATSLVAALRNERDIAVGNAVGSNIFNLVWVLGAAGLISGSVEVSEAALALDFPVMLAVAVACLPVFFAGHVIERWEGATFLGYYFLYATYLVLDAVGSPQAGPLGWFVAGVMVPLTAVVLAVTAARAWREQKAPRDAEP